MPRGGYFLGYVAAGRSAVRKQRLKPIEQWSLALDLRILLKTVPTVLSGSGAM